MEENSMPSFYSILTADVRFDKKISAGSKLLYSDLLVLSKMNGYCYATNKTLSGWYGVSKKTVSRWVSELTKSNYITVEIIYGSKNQVEERRIRMACIPDNEDRSIPDNEDRSILSTEDRPIPKNAEEKNSNININNTRVNNIKDNKEDDFFGFPIESEKNKEDNVPEAFINLTRKHYEKQLQLTPKSTSKKERLNNVNVLKDAKDLYKVSLKFDYDIKILTGMLDYSIKQEFWVDKTTSLAYNSLTKKWANGIKIEMLYEQYIKSNNFGTKVYKDKTDSIDENAVYDL